MDSFEEISDFIQNIIKPDYSNWEDKGDYETRFLEILQQKFN
jgi:dsRNA-specific ribonuclease